MRKIKLHQENQEDEIDNAATPLCVFKGRLAYKVDTERSAILSRNRMAVMFYKELQWDSRHAVANPSGMHVNAQRGLPCVKGCPYRDIASGQGTAEYRFKNV